MRFCFWVLLLLCGLTAVSLVTANDAIPNYQPVNAWPQLPDGMKWGPVSAVAVDATDVVYVAQRAPRPIMVFDREGKFLRSWGDAYFKTVHGLRIDPEGNIWATDIGNHQVMKFDPSGKQLLALGKNGKAGDGPDEFDRPTDIAFGPNGEVFVSDGYGNSRVMKFDRAGKLLKQWGTKGRKAGEFHLPHAILVNSQGRVFVGDRENNRVQVFDTDGNFLEQWTETGAPYGLSFAGNKVLVADGRGACIRVLDTQGKQLGSWGKEGDQPAQFKLPHMLAVDSRGDIYVAEVGNKRIQKFTADSWQGQKVVARRAGLKLTDTGAKGEPIEHAVTNIVYTVVADDGERIRVNFPGQEGWGLKRDWVQLTKAGEFFAAEVKERPDDSFAWSRRGVANRYAGKPELAIKDLDEAVRLAPENFDFVGIRGMMHWAVKDYDNAIRDYSIAVKLNPQYAVGIRNRALARHAKGEYDLAIADFTLAIQTLPRYIFAYQDRATTWRAKGEDRKAYEDLATAIQLEPRAAAAMADLARLLATTKDEKLRDPKRAVELATQANEITSGKDPIILDALASAFAELGDLPRAIQYLEKALTDDRFEKEQGAAARERLKQFQQRRSTSEKTP